MIRRYKAQDQEEVVAVWLATSVSAHPFIDPTIWQVHADDLRGKYLPAADTWVWEEAGKIVGFLSLMGSYVGGLFILPEWQGRGIGGRFIELAKQEHGYLTVGVYHKNEKAKRFYAYCGFRYESEEVQPETGELIINLSYSP